MRKWSLWLGIAGLLALPLFGAVALLIDSQRLDGHRGWYHWLPPFLHFLHPPFFHRLFYIVSGLLGVIGTLVGHVIDRRTQPFPAKQSKH
jgi:hypothetical protein